MNKSDLLSSLSSSAHSRSTQKSFQAEHFVLIHFFSKVFYAM